MEATPSHRRAVLQLVVFALITGLIVIGVATAVIGFTLWSNRPCGCIQPTPSPSAATATRP